MAQLAFQVSAFVHRNGEVRHIVRNRQSSIIPVGPSFYECHLAQRLGSPNSRSSSLRHFAYLYSWALSVGLDLDSLLLSGSGLSTSHIRSFAAWLRNRRTDGSRSLTIAARRTVNHTLYESKSACLWFMDQFTRPKADMNQAVGVQLLINAQERAWKSCLLKVPRIDMAPDLSDDDIHTIEHYLRPSTRGRLVGDVIAHRDYLIWRLTIEMGLRLGEVLALLIAHCPSRASQYFRIVRIEERGDDYHDPRGAYAPRPKTLSRDLGLVMQNTVFPRLISDYVSQYRFGLTTRFGKPFKRFILPHDFLIVSNQGDPLSISAANDIAKTISRDTGVEFHWHLSRHAFFNRAYAAVAEIADAASKEIRLNDLVYWGGWKNPASLDIYSARARRDRARQTLKLWQTGSNQWIALN